MCMCINYEIWSLTELQAELSVWSLYTTHTQYARYVTPPRRSEKILEKLKEYRRFVFSSYENAFDFLCV
jgi:hypothetical protein